ncbi:MAG: hypothetical protein IJO88_06895 [Oscillospiraceae bacterium]|nr:hypothetical protein [Oscillospiraceae bacterium]
MKQGRTYTNIILGLFLAVVVCYFGYYIYSANYTSIRTVTAIEYEAGAGCYTTGFVVRREVPVKSRYAITALMVSEGDRVSSGQSIATGYDSEDAQFRQDRIDQLEHELEQLDYAQAYSSDATGRAELEADLEGHLLAVSRALARRDMNTVEDRSAAIKGLVLRHASSDRELEALSQRITALQGELQSLSAQAGSDTQPVTALQSGYFSGTVDGYESLLTPDTLTALTVEQVENMEPEDVDDSSIGKLITSSTWYYITTVEEELVQDVRRGKTLPVSFVSAFYDALPMTVEHLSEPQDGKQVLILSCDRYLQDVTLLREQSADIVFTSYSGLRVPKEAIRVDENRRTGLYILEAGAAEWKYVELLHDNGESYVVKLDKSSTDELWPGDEIILTAEELYDGKVLLQ